MGETTVWITYFRTGWQVSLQGKVVNCTRWIREPWREHNVGPSVVAGKRIQAQQLPHWLIWAVSFIKQPTARGHVNRPTGLPYPRYDSRRGPAGDVRIN
eukprot:COSAG05_NODE_488_length_9324_cov_10.796336_7_plen_99_part_00